MPTTSVRTTVKTWLTDQLTASLAGEDCEVSGGWPGRHLKRNHVWLDRCTGTVEFRLLMAGRKTREDEFTIRVVFQASAPGDDLASTDERAESYYAALEYLIADDPSLDGMDGIESALLASVEGPVGELTDEGAVSFVFAEVAVHSRLT